eukprot:SAG22_NODE_18534_length_285_cov_1.397849_1_plen_26_part_10
MLPSEDCHSVTTTCAGKCGDMVYDFD